MKGGVRGGLGRGGRRGVGTARGGKGWGLGFEMGYIYARFGAGPAGRLGCWADIFWATVVFRWAITFSCRVRAGTACEDHGPDTARHRVVPTLTLRPSC
jgi:hypothetical protein